mmetsp:Transcript_3768/g.5114  ORF Transcript_3768/g.5114 Transcript_3768/m.5114 type:complete len:96 (+) Transcript_3768:2079-2366(+)
MALIVADTSAAPFPKASKVTPAKRGGKPIFKENISSDGLKKSSAVEPNMRNKVTSQTASSGERIPNHAMTGSEWLQNTKGAKIPSPPLQLRAKVH